jgi:hypothetical protein
MNYATTPFDARLFAETTKGLFKKLSDQIGVAKFNLNKMASLYERVSRWALKLLSD